MVAESKLEELIRAEPHDVNMRQIYADWLDERGDPRGQLLRLQEELRYIGVEHRPEKEARMHQLLHQGVAPLEIRWSNALSMEFLLIFPGEFVMGSPTDEKGREHNETQVFTRLTEPFYLSRFPVTISQWSAVMYTNPISLANQFPITGITYEEASAFCSGLKNFIGLPTGWVYTLPTEAQWEYCCRAGSSTRYFFGEADTRLNDYAWYNSTGISEVGRKKANGWGLFDIVGNVWEMCRDSWQDVLPGGEDPEVTNGNGHVSRGGCFQSTSVECRSACRARQGKSWGHEMLGFRVAVVPVK